MVENRGCKEGSPMMPPRGSTPGDDSVARERLLQSISEDDVSSIGDQLGTCANIDRKLLIFSDSCNSTEGNNKHGIKGQVAHGRSASHGCDGPQIIPCTSVEEKSVDSNRADGATPLQAPRSLLKSGSHSLLPRTQRHSVPCHSARVPGTMQGRPAIPLMHKRYSIVRLGFAGPCHCSALPREMTA